MATIKPRRGSGAPSGLVQYELAVDPTNRRVYLGNAGGTGDLVASHITDYVASVNGSTGAVTNVARTNEGNTFSTKQIMTAGLSASASDTTLEITATSLNGIGMVVARSSNPAAAESRFGRIQLGKAATSTYNTIIENSSGTLNVYNGSTVGTRIVSINTSGGVFDVPITGVTFQPTNGVIRIQLGSYIGGDSPIIRIVGTDVSSNPYNSDIRANASAAANTTHTLPAVTGTLLNTASSYVTSVNGATGVVSNIAVTNTAQTFSGLQTFSTGITSATLVVSGGSTLSAVSASSTTNTIDILASTDAAGIRIAQATSGAGSRIGGIRLGRNSTASNNTYIESATGVLSIYNGIDQTGTNMFNISTSGGAVFNVPIAGATFSGLIQSTSGISASAAITGGSYLYAESGFRVGAGAINSQSGTTYTLLSADNGEVIVWSTASGATLTVPSGLPVGFNCTLIQTGTASIGITGSGTTLNSFEGKLRTAGQHAAVSIISYSSNVFNIAGGLT